METDIKQTEEQRIVTLEKVKIEMGEEEQIEVLNKNLKTIEYTLNSIATTSNDKVNIALAQSVNALLSSSANFFETRTEIKLIRQEIADSELRLSKKLDDILTILKHNFPNPYKK